MIGISWSTTVVVLDEGRLVVGEVVGEQETSPQPSPWKGEGVGQVVKEGALAAGEVPGTSSAFPMKLAFVRAFHLAPTVRIGCYYGLAPACLAAMLRRPAP